MKALLRRRREIATVLLVVVGALIAWGTFGPDPGPQVKGAARWLHDLGRFLSGESPDPNASTDFGPLSREDVGNIVMFLPFGFLFPVRFKRWRWWTIPIGSATSALIELLQLTIARHRDPELIDWVWNTVGTAIGFALWLGLREAWKRRSVWGSPQASQ